MANASVIGEAIRELRQRRRVTIARLALDSGVPAEIISAIEHGRDMADNGDDTQSYVLARHVFAVVGTLGGELRIYVPMAAASVGRSP